MPTVRILLRLLSPNRRRIVYLDRMNPGHALTLTQLGALGWEQYSGTARTDKDGWVVPGTDPMVTPAPMTAVVS